MLLEFYGKECPHCSRMHALVERIEKEEGVKVEKHEVWHDAKNAKKMEEYDKGLCGGVPFFYNTETRKHICGETTYERLRAWVKASI